MIEDILAHPSGRFGIMASPVVGSRGRTGARALGSVSRRVVHEAGCSVLTVPPDSGGLPG